MSNNIALNKPAYASSFVSPFSAQRAVDGTLTPIRRWLCDSSMPGWLSVDLGKTYWIQRWVVKHMGAVGWSSPDYNMKNYSLQGSMDNINWTNLDIVANNTSNSTDRTIPFAQARYVRVNVTTGLNTNQSVASIADFEVYGTSSLLSGLLLRAGKSTINLSPPFNPIIFPYTASVPNPITAVTVIPTAQDSSAVITVNGQIVISGQPSQQINLNVGQNNITVNVASSGDDQNSYTIAVTRSSP
ncbi:MAG: hypothetical protein CVV03_12540 [Firmicutes bacterium HGW-Firmicutes-8]|nr:MAG: hypothetical protein CVV03_12540 [Firmicutes bacterium HGW-Firmicutes-8]